MSSFFITQNSEVATSFADSAPAVSSAGGISPIKAALVAAGILLSLASGTQIQAQTEGPQRTRTLVRVISPKGKEQETPQKTDLRLRLNGHGTDLLALNPVLATDGRGVEIALLIDDGLRGNFSTNLNDLRGFIQELPSNAAVGIGYLQNGRVNFAAPIGAEREAAVKAVRIPLGSVGISASPYFCLSELVKHWPSNTNAARVVLMITNGIDPYNGSTSPLNQNSPYVATAVTDAQKAGVAVYSIYWGGLALGFSRGSFSGQSYLQQVAEGTGGDSYNQGSINPPSITPYLKQFQQALEETYSATFLASGNKPVAIKVTANTHGVKVIAPTLVQPGTGS